MSGYDNYQPPPGPPPGYRSNNPFSQGYQPPGGPPPSHHAPNVTSDDYQPPPGPPPGFRPGETYAPPPGPPPSRFAADSEPPPYHDWQNAVPDNSLLPPPPGFGHDFSPTANASADDFRRAQAWCRAYPLWTPRPLSRDQMNQIWAHSHTIVKQPPYIGDVMPNNPDRGIWKCRTAQSCTDSLLQTALPVFSAAADSPINTQREKTIYFEVKINALGVRHRNQEIDAGIAIGFFAPPYPPFRLPGWERGCLGVHSDDGRRYIADPNGGMDFTDPFKVGQTVGIGMTFRISNNQPPVGYGQTRQMLAIEVFFTRNGKRTGEWNLFEERMDDVEEIVGLQGDRDLFPAVGVYGACDFEIRLDPRHWLYRA